MEHSQVIKYFDEYIKKYSPYQNNEIYLALMEYISQNFMKELYEDIPLQFKQLYEDNFISVDMYNTLLKNIGVPDKILTALSMSEKIILFKNFTDFYRYRGDIYFFNKVSKLFDRTSFDIYELYIDYDTSIDDWVFKPQLLVNNSSEPSMIETNISFDQVYDKVPSFLISKKQLTVYRANKEILLPFKSNIMLLDHSFIYKMNEMINLINATFLKEYKTNTIVCYFIDNDFTFTLKIFYVIWYYILLKTYDSHIGDVPFKWVLMYVDSKNPYSLFDIENLLIEYNAISNSYDSRIFYEKYLSNVFKTYTYSNQYTSSDLEILIHNTEFIEYLDIRLSESTIDQSQQLNLILDELLNSLILNISSSTDEKFIKFSEYFINSLTRIAFDPKKTGSYTLLHNYKPYHTELLSSYNSMIFSNSKFDMVTPNDTKINFLLDLQKADVFNVIDYYINKFIYIDFDNTQILDDVNINTVQIVAQYIKLLDSYSIDFNMSVLNINNILDINDIDFNLPILNQFLPIEKLNINTIQNSLTKLTFNEEKIINILISNSSLNILFDHIIINILNFCFTNNLQTDEFLLKLLFSIDSILTISDDNLINLNINNFLSNVLLIDNQTVQVKWKQIILNIISDVKTIIYNYIDSDDINILSILNKAQYILKQQFSKLPVLDIVNTNYNVNTLSNLPILSSNIKSIINIYHKYGNVINDNFNFNNETNRILCFNLIDYINIGIGGINIGDKVKYELDDDIHYTIVIGFNPTYEYIILKTNYTGSTTVGRLIKQSSISDQFKYLQINSNTEYNEIQDIYYSNTKLNIVNINSLLDNLIFTNTYIKLDNVNIFESTLNYLIYQYTEYNDIQDIVDILYMTSIINIFGLNENYYITHLLPPVQIIESANYIELVCSFENVKMFYTLDGTYPTYNSIEYVNSFLFEGTIINAIAYCIDDYDSYSEISTYSI